jgi:penicillin-binding protein 2
MWGMRRRSKKMVEFDEIFMDSSNLPAFNRGRLEGRLELPISRRSVLTVGGIFAVVVLIFFGKLFDLQVVNGADYRERSDNNNIDQGIIIAERGVIYDRQGEMLAWNAADREDERGFPLRSYSDRSGLGQLLGYVSYPQKDKNGFYYRTDYIGRTGLESAYESRLHGQNGQQLVEVDASGQVISALTVKRGRIGRSITSSVDAALSEAMYDIISSSTEKAGFRSGAGAIMDIDTGEIIALTSFPSYDPEVMANGSDVELIEGYNADERFPFLNKVIGGAYTPGSIVKPFMAYAALAENVIPASQQIFSDGKLTIPNPYDPDQPTIFRDWRAHGNVDMRTAIAYSSDVYFYIIGGGLPAIAAPQAGVGEMPGLGIARIDRYMKMFGLGEKTGIDFPGEQAGLIPTPEWKLETFDEEWRLGNTYHTSIGQFGFLTTPLQMLRAYAALGNGGKLMTPTLIKDVKPRYEDLELDPTYLDIVTDGMRMAVNKDGGTVRGLDLKYVNIAGKSGTAELGNDNAHVNSWVAGFWPYEDPKYAFILLMERAPRSNQLGAGWVMREVFDWMHVNRPEYLQLETSATDEDDE